jgi:hypothetical protein
MELHRPKEQEEDQGHLKVIIGCAICEDKLWNATIMARSPVLDLWPL